MTKHNSERSFASSTKQLLKLKKQKYAENLDFLHGKVFQAICQFKKKTSVPK